MFFPPHLFEYSENIKFETDCDLMGKKFRVIIMPGFYDKDALLRSKEAIKYIFMH